MRDAKLYKDTVLHQNYNYNAAKPDCFTKYAIPESTVMFRVTSQTRSLFMYTYCTCSLKPVDEPNGPLLQEETNISAVIIYM